MPAPDPSSSKTSLGPTATKWFTIAFLVLIVALSGYAVWIASTVSQDPELSEQLLEVHERATRRDPPTPPDSTNRP